MNNSKLAIEKVSLTQDEVVDNTPRLREKETELITILESLKGIQETKEWSTLKTKVFDGVTESLSREMTIEAKKENPDTLKLNRLAGQLKWAEKYSDLSKLENVFRLELTNVRKLLYGKTQESPGSN